MVLAEVYKHMSVVAVYGFYMKVFARIILGPGPGTEINLY